jgi:hypothetical protein
VTLLERALVLLASLALSLLLIAVLSGFFAARDRAGLSGARLPGAAFAQLAEVLPGAPKPRPRLLQDLSAGDVVLAYGVRRAPAALRALARSISGTATRALARAGQAVLLRRIPGIDGLLGLARHRVIRVRNAQDPRLADFARYWLGRGATASAP